MSPGTRWRGFRCRGRSRQRHLFFSEFCFRIAFSGRRGGQAGSWCHEAVGLTECQSTMSAARRPLLRLNRGRLLEGRWLGDEGRTLAKVAIVSSKRTELAVQWSRLHTRGAALQVARKFKASRGVYYGTRRIKQIPFPHGSSQPGDYDRPEKLL